MDKSKKYQLKYQNIFSIFFAKNNRNSIFALPFTTKEPNGFDC